MNIVNIIKFILTIFLFVYIVNVPYGLSKKPTRQAVILKDDSATINR